jgi:hypothetical protein
MVLTKKEYKLLVDIDSTNGVEVNDTEEFHSLVDKKLVIGGARGPGKCWRCVTLTDKGHTVLAKIEEENIKVQIAEKEISWVDVTDESLWRIENNEIIVIHGGERVSGKESYVVSGVEGKPWTFKVECKR